MKKSILIAALCLLKVGQSIAAEKPIDFIIQPCLDKSPYCLEAIQKETNKKLGEISFMIEQNNLFNKEAGHAVFIGYLKVDPQSQRKGIGKALLQAAGTHTNCTHIKLNSVIKAVDFYRHLGFTCNSENYCTKPCNQISLPEPAQTSKLGSHS